MYKFSGLEKQAYLLQALETAYRLNDILVKTVMKELGRPLESAFMFGKSGFALMGADIYSHTTYPITDEEEKSKVVVHVKALEQLKKDTMYLKTYLSKALNRFPEDRPITDQMGYVTAKWVDDEGNFVVEPDTKAFVDPLIEKAWEIEIRIRTTLILYGARI